MARASRFKVGGWIVSGDLNLLETDGRTERLEPQAMDALQLLIARAPDVVSTEELAREVWKGRPIGDGQIYRRIAEIRSAFRDDSRSPRYVETIPKRGYRLCANVEPLVESSFVERALPLRWQRAAALGAALALAGLALFVFDDSPIDDGPVIAVLPFSNSSNEAAQVSLGESIADELIHALSNAPGLTVIARTSSFSFADSDSDLAEIGERLGASIVLEGSVRRRRAQLDVTAQLVESATNHVLWSETFNQPLEDLIGVERRIALAVAERVLGPDADTTRVAAALPPLADLSAYEYYLLGRQRIRRGHRTSMSNWPRADADQAVAYFRRAISADPSFARAYTGLADALLFRTVIGRGFEEAYEAGVPDDVAQEALGAIDRALELEPDLADARISQGLAARILDGNLARALELYREAVELNPNLVEAHAVLGRAGSGEASVAALRKAAELEPMSADIMLWAGRRLAEVGRNEEAARHIERAITLEDPPVSALLLAANRRTNQGRPDEAIRLLRPYLGREGFDYGEHRIRAWLAIDYLDLGAPQAARELLGPREPGEPLAITNARAHLAIAEGDHDLIADLLHERTAEDLDLFYALYEQVIGHEDHAMAQYEAIALENEFESPAQNLFSWGYSPAVNWALLYLEAGEDDRATELLEAARDSIARKLVGDGSTSGALYVLSGVEAIEGNTDRALDLLEQAFAAGWTKHWYVMRDPLLESLRDEPRLRALVASLKADMDALRAELEVAPP